MKYLTWFFSTIFSGVLTYLCGAYITADIYFVRDIWQWDFGDRLFGGIFYVMFTLIFTMSIMQFFKPSEKEKIRQKMQRKYY